MDFIGRALQWMVIGTEFSEHIADTPAKKLSTDHLYWHRRAAAQERAVP
jgi:hypothetical protein